MDGCLTLHLCSDYICSGAVCARSCKRRAIAILVVVVISIAILSVLNPPIYSKIVGALRVFLPSESSLTIAEVHHMKVLGTLFACFGQNRFAAYYAINVAVLCGFVSWKIIEFVWLRGSMSEETVEKGRGKKTKERKKGGASVEKAKTKKSPDDYTPMWFFIDNELVGLWSLDHAHRS